MKYPTILCFLLIFALAAFGQPPKSTSKKTPKPAKTVAPKIGSEAEEFEKARNTADAAARLTALQEFIKNFPESTEIPKAQSLIVTARAETGIIKMQAGDAAGGIELYKQAILEAPVPVPDETFSKVLIGLPVSLYALNQRAAAFDVAKLIEDKIGANAEQTVALAKFYLNVEYGTEAIRLATKAAEIAPASAAAQQTLGNAYRLNFRLEDAANAYTKAIELDGESLGSRLSLAEMKRALGKTDEAAAIYREVLSKDAANKAAQTGLALTLLDADKRADAESELKIALEAEPNNAKLLASAAYWYAARGLNEQAIEYAQKAIAAEPRNVWAYIAQSRALVAQNKPLEAEKVLLLARGYSDFPTLDYELASVRLAAGLYREAAETLKRSFAVNKEGLIETYLGNRILADAGTFTELLSLERRTAIFETKAADSAENTEKLKALLAFEQKLKAFEAKETTEDELAAAAEEFAKGGDNMRLHRQLFAANSLLQKKAALPKVLELTQSAIGGVDSSLSVAAPSAAVLADEIYDSRQYAISQNLIIVVPDIPRPTLSAILRGRIEDIAGRALFQQNNISQSIVRLKRALSVMPEKSAFSRASYWHLGEALQADGKEKEALEAFIKGYNKEIPDAGKRAFIENLYVKVNGNIDGLEEKVGAKPETVVATTGAANVPTNSENARTPEPTPAPTETKSTALPESVPAIEPSKTPESKPAISPADIIVKESPLMTNQKLVIDETNKNRPVPEETKKTEETASPEPKETPQPEEVKAEEVKAEEVKSEETKPQEAKPEPLPTPTPTETPQPVEDKPQQVKPEPNPAETPQTTPETTPTPEIKPEETKPAEETKPEENKPAETKSVETKPEEKKPAATRTEPVPEPTATPQGVSVIISDNLKQVPPSPKVTEKKPPSKPKEVLQNVSKPLFEPVVISVGKTDQPKQEEPQPDEPKQTEQKPAENLQNAEVALTETATKETAKEEAPKPSNKPAEEKIASGEYRPRIIITETSGNKTITEEIATCKLVVNQEIVSLLNGGGSLGVMVGFEGEGDFRQITAVSNSPDDVDVRLDSDIAASQQRAFFLVKSVSRKTGVFTVTFTAPCGRKEILIKVR